MYELFLRKTMNFMEIAIEEALKAQDNNEVPIGAVLVHRSGEIISKAYNLIQSSHDPTSHAEIVAIRLASKKLKTSRLVDCDLFVTMEPCLMCAGAISNARIRRIYFGAYASKRIDVGVSDIMKYYSSNECNHTPEIYGGILEIECSKLIKSYFGTKR